MNWAEAIKVTVFMVAVILSSGAIGYFIAKRMFEAAADYYKTMLDMEEKHSAHLYEIYTRADDARKELQGFVNNQFCQMYKVPVEFDDKEHL